jgi:hypothetical protein
VFASHDSVARGVAIGQAGTTTSALKEISMSKAKRTKPIAGTGAPDAPDVPPAGEADDTEGHSLGLLIGFNALSQAREADSRERTKKVPEEELPPLSKKWPSMRQHKKT